MLRFLLSHIRQPEYRAYLWRSVFGWLRPGRFRCPVCGESRATSVARKAVVTVLVRCAGCGMQYRLPPDPPNFSDRLYQDAYDAGYYSEVPPPEKLRDLLATKFAGTPRDHRHYIEMLQSLGAAAGRRVFEFGASWGYGTWQLQAAGFETLGYELSRNRARFARESVGVRVEDDLTQVPDGFDYFFSAHVLEHLPRPQEAFTLAQRLLKPGGWFVAVVPNGSAQRRAADPSGFQMDWGMYHPVFYDEVFFKRWFGDCPLLLASTPFPHEQLRAWDRRSRQVLDLSGNELLFVLASERLADARR